MNAIAQRSHDLFSVPFKSRMTDDDVARLHGELDLVTYLTPKPGVSGASLGVVRIPPRHRLASTSARLIPPGRAANKRLARLGRRLQHLE